VKGGRQARALSVLWKYNGAKKPQSNNTSYAYLTAFRNLSKGKPEQKKTLK
jgi:hypothetical protein